jgi:hypothetical protein
MNTHHLFKKKNEHWSIMIIKLQNYKLSKDWNHDEKKIVLENTWISKLNLKGEYLPFIDKPLFN